MGSMDEVNARSVKGSPTIEVDPRFFVPTDIIDIRQGVIFDPETFRESPELINTSTDVNAVVVDNTIQAPSEITIVGQSIHVLPDGTQAIDITLDVVGDTFGTNYNVRINKA